MPAPRSWRALLVGVAVTGASAVGAPAPANAAAPPAPSWQDCTPQEQAGFQCARWKVPLDYDRPNGQQIELSLIRKLAADPSRRRGSVFWNAGGPGGAATAVLPLLYKGFSPQVKARFDVVSFDPRGVRESTQLQCFASAEEEAKLFAPFGPKGFPYGAAEVAKAPGIFRKYNAACAANGGPIQNHMGTADVARDMDRLRQALREPKLDYYGPSYGSYLGATYINLFPRRVGRVLLDGNVPPVQWNDAKAGRSETLFARIQSPLGSELGMRLLLTRCGSVSTARCSFSAGSPRATIVKYRALLKRLKTRTVTVSEQPFDYAYTLNFTLSMLQSEQPDAQIGFIGWKGIADVLQEVDTASKTPSGTATASRGVRRALRSAAKGGGLAPEVQQGVREGTDGVLCGESPSPRDIRTYGAQARRVNKQQSPLGYGYPWTWLAAGCAGWKGVNQDVYRGPWNKSPVPILLVGTLADSNTPYTGTLRMARQLGNTRVLTERGGGHTAQINQSACINRYADAFFLRGALPPKGTVCSQDKQPF